MQLTYIIQGNWRVCAYFLHALILHAKGATCMQTCLTAQWVQHDFINPGIDSQYMGPFVQKECTHPQHINIKSYYV